MAARPSVTRLAPSPTGSLHLGNARTFLINWLLARKNGWRIVMRIEDLDRTRAKPGFDQQAMDDLQWLGIDWDAPPSYQSQRTDLYRAAIDRLFTDGIAYPCTCTRKEVALAASAPHLEDGTTIYPGTCRARWADMQTAQSQTGRPPAIRFRMPDRNITWNDQFLGAKSFNAEKTLGDFVLATRDGITSYQLAVVMDDAEAGVTHIVRGDDLTDSTPRQLLIYEALSLGPIPQYWHLPMVIGEDGHRLAKRHGDTRIGQYRSAGIDAGRLLQLLARWCGISEPGDVKTAADLVESFDIDCVPRHPVVFTAADDAWLMGQTNA